jgi:membrane associated rhomboid family serine protease
LLPIGDIDYQRRSRPYVTYAFIGLNVLVFLYELSLGGSLFFSNSIDVTQFFYKWGAIPQELFKGDELERIGIRIGQIPDLRTIPLDVASPVPTWATAFSSMFIHGGWLHLMGNMLYLWVFADNIEDRFGHLKFLLFYLGAGLAAVWTQVILNSDSTVPMVGASGAISGVTGAYLLLFPFNRIKTVVIFYFIAVISVPAVILLGFWFVLQLFQGVGSIGALGGGVAYWAHVGGFLMGLLAAALYKLVRREPLWPRRPRNPWDRFPGSYYG